MELVEVAFWESTKGLVPHDGKASYGGKGTSVAKLTERNRGLAHPGTF